jgi:hypothetical protein
VQFTLFTHISSCDIFDILTKLSEAGIIIFSVFINGIDTQCIEDVGDASMRSCLFWAKNTKIDAAAGRRVEPSGARATRSHGQFGYETRCRYI